ncbi:unnamed protein product [Brassica oleracea]
MASTCSIWDEVQSVVWSYIQAMLGGNHKALNIFSGGRDVKQVYPSRPIPYRGGLVIDRVTVGLSRTDCGPQNAGPNPYHKTYRPSRVIPQDASFSNRLLQFPS